MFVRLVLTMDQRAWPECHVEAFAFFGGVPKRLVPGQPAHRGGPPGPLRPKINRSYAELAQHHGCLVDPARRGKPKDKPRVERPMPYVRDSLWRGQEWVSLQQMQDAALTWCPRVVGRRTCRPLQGASPISVFEAVEAAALLSLPRKPFALATWSAGKVGPDIHVTSVPWRHIGRRVDARSTPTTVQIFDDGQLIATHGRCPAGKATDLCITRRRRSPSPCAARSGAAPVPPKSARPRPR